MVISISEAKKNMNKLIMFWLENAEKSIVITKNGKPIAELKAIVENQQITSFYQVA